MCAAKLSAVTMWLPTCLITQRMRVANQPELNLPSIANGTYLHQATLSYGYMQQSELAIQRQCICAAFFLNHCWFLQC